MRSGQWRKLLGLGLAMVLLGLVFAAYLQPELMVTLANFWVLCGGAVR